MKFADTFPGMNPYLYYFDFSARPQSATVSGWSPNSVVPLSVINRFLKPSNYHIEQNYNTFGPPTTANFSVTFIPEPSMVLVFLFMIGGLGVARRIRVHKLGSCCQ